MIHKTYRVNLIYWTNQSLSLPALPCLEHWWQPTDWQRHQSCIVSCTPSWIPSAGHIMDNGMWKTNWQHSAEKSYFSLGLWREMASPHRRRAHFISPIREKVQRREEVTPSRSKDHEVGPAPVKNQVSREKSLLLGSASSLLQKQKLEACETNQNPLCCIKRSRTAWE